MKKIKDNITMVIIVGIILLSALLIGSPLNRENVHPIFIASGVLCIFYYLIKREKIIKDKIDICILFLSFSAILPLIFKTYVSLSGTVFYIMKYFCVLNMFLITKHECQKNPKYVNVILNTIIFSILVQCIFGIDEIIGNSLKDFKDKIGYLDVGLVESRIGGIFGYANTMAAVAAAGVFLCIGYIFNTEKIKVKLIYIAIGIVMLITMILTYSRLMFIVFAVMAIVYILILLKKYKIREKLNKKVVLYSVPILIILIIYIIVGLQIPSELNVKDVYQKKLFGIQGNADYDFSFDIEANANEEKSFTIEIIEYDEYLFEINTQEIKFGTFSGKKQIKIHTQTETNTIYVKIKNNEEDGRLIINQMTLNGEEEILNYKLLPTNLVFKIQQINLNQKSAWQRFVFIEDAFKIIKDNWLVGLGGDAWQRVQLEVQEYSYYAREVHSFPTQTFLENGILGFVACLGIMAYTIKMLYKQVKKQDMDILKISAIISVLTILLHSIFDMNMSFFYVLFMVFLIIATFEAEKKHNCEKADWPQKIIMIILILVSIFTMYISIIQISYKNDTSKTVKDYERYSRMMPFNLELNEIKYRRLERINNPQNNTEIMRTLEKIIQSEKYESSNLNLSYIHSYIKIVLKINEDLDDRLNYALEYVNDTDEFSKYKANFQIVRLTNLKEIIELLYEEGQVEYAHKFNEQLLKEISEKAQCILDYKKSKYSKDKVDEYKVSISELEEFIKDFSTKKL